MARAISPALRTLFAELLQQLENAPAAGSVYRRRTDAGEYIYAKVPVGVARVDTFVGKAGDAEAEERAAAFQLGSSLAVERRRLVSTLKSQGLAAPDRTMGAVLDALAHAGLFRAGAVLVGTSAYLLSEPLVGSRLPSPTLMTGDVDIAAASLALASDPPQTLESILKRADDSFRGLPQLTRNAAPSRFRNANGYLVELVTPTRRRDDPNPLELAALGAGAEPLQHLAWLIQDAVRTAALWGSGVQVNVPQPARYAVHKLILAQRRDAGSRMKRAKDLAQAGALIDALRADDPFALEDALADARAQGEAGWRRPIARSLAELGVTDIAED